MIHDALQGVNALPAYESSCPVPGCDLAWKRWPGLFTRLALSGRPVTVFAFRCNPRIDSLRLFTICHEKAAGRRQRGKAGGMEHCPMPAEPVCCTKRTLRGAAQKPEFIQIEEDRSRFRSKSLVSLSDRRSAALIEQGNDLGAGTGFAKTRKDPRDAVLVGVQMHVGHRVDRQGDVEPQFLSLSRG